MKSTLYFLALSVSLLLTACSSNEQEALPFAPQVEKMSVNDVQLPFPYLTSFGEVQDLKIDVQHESKGMIIILNVGSRIINNMYAVIEQQGNPVMVYLGSSEEKKYFIKNFNPSRNFNIRIFGDVRNDTRRISVPYAASSVFNNIPVKGWSASNTDIKVSSGSFPSALKHLYVLLETKKGSFLVFLGRPVGEDFEIPKYGSFGVGDLRLFGLSENIFTEG